MHKVDDLTGGLLDAAVAASGEWERAHEHFPTMTLDPSVIESLEQLAWQRVVA